VKGCHEPNRFCVQMGPKSLKALYIRRERERERERERDRERERERVIYAKEPYMSARESYISA